MIKVENVGKRFIRKTARASLVMPVLQNVSFTAEDGSITALLGPNGAGKTTLMRIIAGLEVADCGHVMLENQSVAKARRGLGYFNEKCGLYPRLTALENIVYHARLYHVPEHAIAQRIQAMQEPLDLARLLPAKVSGFSQGERMRVALARTLVHAPKTIILDEPTNGLDLASVRRLRLFIRFLASSAGGSHCILLSSHVMHEVEKIADKVVIISGGKICAMGTPRQISLEAGCGDFEEAFAKLAFSNSSLGGIE